MTSPLLHVEQLSVSFPLRQGVRSVAVDGVDLAVHAKRTLAVVGESGSGKSVTALAAMGLLPRAARVDSGRILLSPRSESEQALDLLQQPEAVLQSLRGKDLAMIFQEPMTSLNPVLSIREQLEESLILHSKGLERKQRTQRIESVLQEVGMEHAIARLDQYPHQFSGGMRQRIMIAIALICEPRVLFADEPTTALDVTVQAQVLDLIASIRESRGLGVVLITHDLGVVRKYSHDVCVMYAGRIVERAPTQQLFANPVHPYTRALLACVPTLVRDGTAPQRGTLQTVRALLEADASDAQWTLPTGARAWWPWHDAKDETARETAWCEVSAQHEVLTSAARKR
jgi:peptide/nickel transport system ATP-binding protein